MNWKELEVKYSSYDPQRLHKYGAHFSEKKLSRVVEALRKKWFIDQESVVVVETVLYFKMPSDKIDEREAREFLFAQGQEIGFEYKIIKSENVYEFCIDLGIPHQKVTLGPYVLSEEQINEDLTLSSSDKKVIDGFLNGKTGGNKKFQSKSIGNKLRLDGLWMGGDAIAEFDGNEDVVFKDLGSRAAQTVQRYIKKKAKELKLYVTESELNEAELSRLRDVQAVCDLFARFLTGDQQHAIAGLRDYSGKDLLIVAPHDTEMFYRLYRNIFKAVKDATTFIDMKGIKAVCDLFARYLTDEDQSYAIKGLKSYEGDELIMLDTKDKNNKLFFNLYNKIFKAVKDA